MPKAPTESWFWSYFHRHPKYSSKDSEAFASGNKAKAYCKKCFDADILAIQLEDQAAVSSQQRDSVRSQADIEKFCMSANTSSILTMLNGSDAKVWSTDLKSKSRGWLRGATTTLVNHLRNCDEQLQATRSLAESQHDGISSRQGHRTSLGLGLQFKSHSEPNTSANHSSMSQNSPLGFSTSRSYDSYDGSVPPSPALSFNSNFHSGSPALGYSPAVSDSYLPLTNAPSRSQSQLGLRRVQSRQSFSTPWTPQQQKSFETRIARLTASAGLPLSWVDNVEWIDFCQEFVPAAKSPSRKTLTRRLLPTAVAELRRDAKASVKGFEATVQGDGWTGENHHHLIAFMVSVEGKVHSERFCRYSDLNIS
jgi:hypothetical protein